VAQGEGSVASRSRPSAITAARVAIGVGIALLAFATAPAAALVSRMAWRPGSVTLPYGLLLSAVASAAVIVIARSVGRGYAFLAAAAWLVALGFVVEGTSGGGFLVADDSLGWSFLVFDTAAVLGTSLLGGGRR
jgi:hypothetical protein